MSHSEICPVCNGSGKYIKPNDPKITGNINIEVTCHGCQGAGWIEVGKKDLPRPLSLWSSIFG